MLNNEYQSMAANAIAHEAKMVGIEWQYAGSQMSRPSVLFRPTLSMDGSQWCALYGSNIQEGIAGFGESPEKAMRHFDQMWYEELK